MLALILSACKPSTVQQDFEFSIRDTQLRPISNATVLIDHDIVGASDSNGRWSGRLNFPANSKHTISIQSKSNQRQAPEWVRSFTAENRRMRIDIELDKVDVTMHRYGSTDDSPDSLADDKKVTPESDGARQGNSNANMVELWRQSYSKHVGELPPVMPWQEIPQKISKNTINTAEELNSNKETVTPTFYFRHGPLPIEGAEVWISEPKLKAICVTNQKGRCSPDLEADIKSVLIKKRGFRSVVVQINGEGTYQLEAQTGHSQDLSIQAEGSEWIAKSSGMEIARGQGDSFLVIDKIPDNLSLHPLNRPLHSQSINIDPKSIIEVQMAGSSRDKNIYISKLRLAGDFEGDVASDVRKISGEINNLVNGLGYKVLSAPRADAKALQITLIKTLTENLIESQFLNGERLPLGFGLSNCQNGFRGCIKKSIEQALEKSLEPFMGPSLGPSLGPSFSLSSPKEKSSFNEIFERGSVGRSEDFSQVKIRPLVDKDNNLGPKREDSLVLSEGIESNQPKISNNKTSSKKSNERNLKIGIVNEDNQKISGVRIYCDGQYLQTSDQFGSFLASGFSGNTFEFVKEGHVFQRKYWKQGDLIETITLSSGSRFVEGQLVSGSAQVVRDFRVIGVLPGVIATKLGSLKVIGPDDKRHLNIPLLPGEDVDLGVVKFYPDLMKEWAVQLGEGDFEGAHKTLQKVDEEHPDYIAASYLLAEKKWVEHADLPAVSATSPLKDYVTFRWLLAKANGPKIVNEGNLEDLMDFQNSVSNILPLSDFRRNKGFGWELNYLKSLAELRQATMTQDSEKVRVALYKVNRWLEYPSSLSSMVDGRKIWDLARNDLIEKKRGL